MFIFSNNDDKKLFISVINTDGQNTKNLAEKINQKLNKNFDYINDYNEILITVPPSGGFGCSLIQFVQVVRKISNSAIITLFHVEDGKRVIYNSSQHY